MTEPATFAAQIEVIKPAFDTLGPYPILQAGAAIIIVMAFAFGGMLWLRGEKGAKREADKPLDAPRTPEGAVQLFFDGPLKAIFDVLHEIQTMQATNKLELKDVLLQQLSLNKAAIYDTVTQLQAEVLADTLNQHRDTHAKLDLMAQQLREMRDVMVRVEARQTLGPGQIGRGK